MGYNQPAELLKGAWKVLTLKLSAQETHYVSMYNSWVKDVLQSIGNGNGKEEEFQLTLYNDLKWLSHKLKGSDDPLKCPKKKGDVGDVGRIPSLQETDLGKRLINWLRIKTVKNNKKKRNVMDYICHALVG